MDLSLIIPCYNEAPHLKGNVELLIRVLESTGYKYEIIFVDDASSDQTPKIINEICKTYQHCLALLNYKNQGRGGAFKAGFLKSKGRVVGFIDIDLEISASNIPALVNLIDVQGHDVAIGRRMLFTRGNNPLRCFISFLCKHFCSFILKMESYDSQVGCKFFNRQKASSSILDSKSNDWFWDTEVIYRSVINHLKIIDLPVIYKRRPLKKSTVRVIPDTINFLKNLQKLRHQVGLSFFTRSPLYWSIRGYNFMMRLLMGSNFQKSFKQVSEFIPSDVTVTDVCSGTGLLYNKYLKYKKCEYLGLDYNGHFVSALSRQKIKSSFFDVRYHKIPSSDYVVMVSSFYHFYHQQKQIFESMKSSAKKAVIISEPVHNLSNHSIPFLARFANWVTKPGEGEYDYRYDLDKFKEFAQNYGATEFYYNPGDRNAVAVFRT